MFSVKAEWCFYLKKFMFNGGTHTLSGTHRYTHSQYTHSQAHTLTRTHTGLYRITASLTGLGRRATG